MSRTKHMKVRMNQRAIDKQLIELVLNFGASQIRGSICKYYLSKKYLHDTSKN